MPGIFPLEAAVFMVFIEFPIGFWLDRISMLGASMVLGDESFRLRLHSGLRQRGSAFGAAFLWHA
jgi:hypothetical protein